MVDFFFQGTCSASSTPVCSYGSRHEVHSHDEAQWQHGALRVPLELLQDVKAGQGKERDPCEPEEAAKDGVQQVKEAAQEHGEEPVCHEYGGDEEQGAGWRVGERCGAEVMAEVRGYKGKREKNLTKTSHINDDKIHFLIQNIGLYLLIFIAKSK